VFVCLCVSVCLCVHVAVCLIRVLQFTGALNPAVPIINYKVEFSRFSNLFNALGPDDTSIVRLSYSPPTVFNVCVFLCACVCVCV